MPSSREATEGDGLAEAVRRRCVEAALDAYEDAALAGLCREGAWELAVDAMRSLDLAAPADGGADPRPPAPRGLGDLSADLAGRFAAPGVPAGGTAAAATGAMAAGLLEWGATLCQQRGPADFRKRARAIAGRAAVLRASLASAGEADAAAVRALFASAPSADARRRACESALGIATGCAQATALTAEVRARVPRAARPDLDAALQLAATAARVALDLAEPGLRPDPDEPWARDAKRSAWKARLLLQRAAPFLRQDREPATPDPRGEGAN